VFTALATGLAIGIWGSVVRPPAYEVKGTYVARAAPEILLIRHDAVEELGMAPMELMAVFADPRQLDAASLAPGDRLRLAVRRRDDHLILIRLEKLG
jgi:hypothetical protein